MRKSILQFFLIFVSIVLLPSDMFSRERFVLVIDPGHGGGDVGTPHRKMKQDEKTIALNVALKLGKMIEEELPDVSIVYTRKTDVYPTLPDRVRMAKEAKGDLMISIHVNAAADASARGVETYVFGITGLQGKSEAEQKRIRERTMEERENLDIDGKQVDFENTVDLETKILCQAQREKHNKYSREVAHYIQDNIMSALHRSSYSSRAHDRGVKSKNIYVLCYSPMPAILVEMGYMSNLNEEVFLNTAEAQNLFAKSMFKGVKQYYANWKRRQLKEEETNAAKAEAEAAAAARIAELKARNNGYTILDEQPVEVNSPGETMPIETKPAETTPIEAKPAETKQPEVKPVETKPAETKPVENKPAEVKPVKSSDQIRYRIQFLTSSRELKKGAPELKGLWPVDFYKDGDVYRYTFGDAPTKADLQADMLRIRNQFGDAFVVKFDENGNRIR